MRALRFLWILLLLAPASAQEKVRRPEHVVIISIDGLRPEFYLDDAWEAPTLRALAKAGAHAKGVEGVYPSVTYASHASIVTGVRPAKHGVHGNTKFGELGGTSEWYWETKDLKAKTLWMASRDAKKSTAIIYWPSSVGAKVDLLVPERWAVFEGEKTSELLAKHSTPGLLPELGLSIGLPSDKDVKDTAKIDVFITKALCYVIKKWKPALAFTHLIQVDHFEHEAGRDGVPVHEALKRMDDNIAAILAAIKEAGLAETTAVVIVGDHGFEEAAKGFSPNVLLREAGLIEYADKKVKSWKAICHASGGSGAVYAKDADSAKKAREVLEKQAVRDGKRVFTIVDRKALDELGYNPEAAFAVEAEPPWMILGSTAGADAFNGKAWNKGQHGYLPTKPRLYTGFIACGPGFNKGAVIDKMRLIDIAPTLASLMGLEMKDVEGKVLDALLEK